MGDAAARAATSVVLAAAGSSDPAARAVIEALAARWARERGWLAVLPAFASADGPRPEQAVAAALDFPGRVVVATYLLAPGYFADKVRDASLAAGAAAVSDVLGAAPGGGPGGAGTLRGGRGRRAATLDGARRGLPATARGSR